MTAQVAENEHLTHIFVSDVLPDGLAYKEGIVSCLCLKLFIIFFESKNLKEL